MSHLRIIAFGLCLGLSSSTCNQVNHNANRKDLGKTHRAPNGLDNNGANCYANATLQLLAACFAKEIKDLPGYTEDANKKQLRDNLLMIVDHINAKEQQDPRNARVLQAVNDLTTSLGTKDSWVVLHQNSSYYLMIWA